MALAKMCLKPRYLVKSWPLPDSFAADAFVDLFRFNHGEYARLVRALDLPLRITLRSRRGIAHPVFTEAALLVLLRRLAYPTRLSDIEGLFGVSCSTLSRACRRITEILQPMAVQRLRRFARIAERADAYAEAMSRLANSPMRCIGAIDGTSIEVRRPSRGQQAMYSGHHGEHCFSFTGIALPDGILLLDRAIVGRHNDCCLSNIGTLAPLLNELFTS